MGFWKCQSCGSWLGSYSKGKVSAAARVTCVGAMGSFIAVQGCSRLGKAGIPQNPFSSNSQAEEEGDLGKERQRMALCCLQLVLFWNYMRLQSSMRCPGCAA